MYQRMPNRSAPAATSRRSVSFLIQHQRKVKPLQRVGHRYRLRVAGDAAAGGGTGAHAKPVGSHVGQTVEMCARSRAYRRERREVIAFALLNLVEGRAGNR